MGMFDSVYFTCPKCGKLLEAQSKSGHCTLACFALDSVPAEIGDDLVGTTIQCDIEIGGCGEVYTIIEPPVIRKTMKLALWAEQS